MSHHTILPALLTLLTLGSMAMAEAPAPPRIDFFPATVQFSPVPSGKGWKGEKGPLSEQVLRDTIDNILAHGFTGIQTPTHRPKNEEAIILRYAQSRGMIITHHAGAMELFGRNKPPKPSVYSPDYPKAVRKRVEQALAPLKNIPRLYNVFTFQDEPFHWGPKSFGYGPEVQAEFKKRYGYPLPPDIASLRNDPKRWLDVLTFRSDNFADAWRQVYKIIKQTNPNFKTVLTHDSHNTFGGGCGSHAEMALDDVFHWGGDFADMFVFDIYPYMMHDHRFGQCSRLPKPRISQTHYAFAQMRNLTYTYGKDLGFWVGTYNPAWFRNQLGPKLQAMHWAEREMSATAVAHGSNFLLTGYNIPIDAGHWDSFGKGIRLLQKAGARLLDAPKVKARAAMLYPRTHTLQLQEEYYNVGLSFELFLRTFGELDILHEEQVTDDTLGGIRVLALFDVKLLPRKTAEHIAAFVRNGGVVIADCVPHLDELRKPLATMETLFGVTKAATGRIHRTGHYVPRVTCPPYWYKPAKNPSDESKFPTDALKGTALGQPLDLTLVSPRPCTVTTASALLATAAGKPGVVHRTVGKGQVFLLGFCLQDTYFKTWQDANAPARAQLRGLLGAMAQAAGAQPRVGSSNPEIEAAVRANAREGFLFVINHEAAKPDTRVALDDIGFPIARILDLADGRPVPFKRENGRVTLTLTAPLGHTRLLHLLPR